MKIFTLSLLLCLFYFVDAHAQSVNCYELNNKLKNDATLKDVTNVYSLLLSDKVKRLPNQNLTPIVRAFLADLGKCFIQRAKYTKGFQLYQIPEDMISEAPAMVFLLIKSESIETKVDKQSWFSLYPMMNDVQKNKLLDILWREKIKMAEISSKYDSEKDSIAFVYKSRWEMINEKYKDFSNKIFGLCEYGEPKNKIYGVWKNTNGMYFLANNQIGCREVEEITPKNLVSFIEANQSIKYDLKGKFDEYKEDYENYLLGSTNETIKTFTNVPYHVGFWSSLIDEMSKEPTKANELEIIANLNFDELAKKDTANFSVEDFERIQKEKYWQLFSIYQKLDKFKEMCDYRIKTLDLDSRGIVLDSYYTMLFQNNKECDSCNKFMYDKINEYLENDWDSFLQETERRKDFQTDLMVWNFIAKFSKNTALSVKAESIYKKLSEIIINEDESIFSEQYSLQKWYYVLNQTYLGDKFTPTYDMYELAKLFDSIECVRMLPNTKTEYSVDKDATKVEFFTYYSLWQIINNEKGVSKDNIAQILNEVKKICTNPSSKAYQYLEKDIAEMLLQYMQSKKVADTQKPQIVLNEKMLSFKTEAGLAANTSQIEFYVDIVDNSEIVSTVEVMLNHRKYEIFEDERTKDGLITTGMVRLDLQVGQNIISVKAVDEFGNEAIQEFEITLTDKPIKKAKYYALMIGIDKYPNGSDWKNLATCTNDCKVISKVLREKYNFSIDTLYNSQATRKGIISKIESLKSRTDLDSNSNVLIYFSGHGQEEDNTAYWIPSDVSDNTSADWISTSDIKSKVRAISQKIRHSLVMVDACFSGVMFNKDNDSTAKTLPVDEYYLNKSAHGLTSGGNKPVPSKSENCNEHSPFACALKTVLDTNQDEYLYTSDLSVQVKRQMARDKAAIDGKQTSHYGALGEQTLGEFIFIQKKQNKTISTESKTKSSQPTQKTNTIKAKKQ